jgi:hypothetical protein
VTDAIARGAETMAQLAAPITQRPTHPWWLQALYGVLVASAVALVALVVGEVYYAFEASGEGHTAHDHGPFGAIFDLAWFIFLPSAAATFVGAVVLSVVGAFTRRRSLTRYGLRATAYVAFAVGVIVVAALLEI